jgi:hypothetical protein
MLLAVHEHREGTPSSSPLNGTMRGHRANGHIPPLEQTPAELDALEMILALETPMDRAKFLELQFQTLRKEIEETKSRIFTLELGLIGAPLIPPLVQIFLRPSNTSELNSLWENLSGLFIAATPFFIIILMSAFIAQRTGLMRCGTYIRCHIEPLIDGITGWETWLETRPRQRRSDQFSFYSFLLICFFY